MENQHLFRTTFDKYHEQLGQYKFKIKSQGGD